MTTLTLTLDACCPGLGHWTAVIARDGQALAAVPLDWAELQAPLADDEHVALLRLALRAKCAGLDLAELEPILSGGLVL
jgi:hypothetical protein